MNPTFLPAITIFVLSAYLAYRQFRWSLYLLAAFLPFVHKEFFGFGFKELLPARIVLLAILTIGASQVASYFKARGISKVTAWIKEDKFLLLMFALWLWRLISISYSGDKLFSLQVLGFFTAAVGIYLILRYAYEKYGWEFIKKFLLVYAGAVGAAALFVPVQLLAYFIFDLKLFAVWPLESGAVRFGSFGWDINHYAAYLVSALPLLYLLAISQKNVQKKLLWGGGFLVVILGWVLSISRSGWLAGIIALTLVATFLVIKRKIKAALPLVGLGILSLVAVVVLAWTKGYFLEDRFLSLVGLQQSDSTSAHTFLLKAGYEVFKTSPILGVGYGAFNQAFRALPLAAEYFEKDPIGLARLPAHSIWLEVLAETGIVGIVLYAALIGVILWGLLKSFLTAPKELSLTALAFFSAILGLTISGIFYSYNLEFFWITLFLGYFVSHQGRKHWPKLPAAKRELGLITDVLAIPGVMILAAVFIFNNLGRNALIDWDESIYATISRNIIRSSDWISLYWRRLGAEWFEKPPLYMWLTSLLLRLDQYNDLFTRFWSALSGVLGVGLMYLLGKKLFNRRVGFMAALVLASTVHWVWQGRNGTLDEMAAFLTALTLYFFWMARAARSNLASLPGWTWQRAIWWGLVGVGLGLVVMAKGAVVAVPLAVMGGFAVCEMVLDRSFKKYLNWRILLVPLGALLVAGPWHFLVWQKHGQDFIDSYFIYHVLKRTGGIEGHGEPFWWYNTVIRHWFRHWYALLLVALPTLVVLTAKKLKERRAELFILIWAVVTFFLFSPSKSKIQWYILSIYPALALINGRFLDEVGGWVLGICRDVKSCVSTVFWGFGFLVLVLSVPITLNLWKPMWFPPDFNYDLSESAEAMRYFSNDADILYTYKFAPGPALWYSDREVEDITRERLIKILTSGGRYFVLLPVETWCEMQPYLSRLPLNQAPQTLYSEKTALLVGYCDWPSDRETGELLFTCRDSTGSKEYVESKRRVYIE